MQLDNQTQEILARAGDKPITLVSACTDNKSSSDYIYSGGVKLRDLWVKLMCQYGYPAYRVTFDGTHKIWLVNHSPCISLAVAEQLSKSGHPMRYVTDWALASLFIQLADELYFWDCELAYTVSVHFAKMQKLVETKIRGIATLSRTEQAWYMATFDRPITFLPIWLDDTLWYPKPEVRREGRIGYIFERGNREYNCALVDKLNQLCVAANVDVEFVEIWGDEQHVIDEERMCDLYVGLNPGKHTLWGEGGPLTQLEAMMVGCVVIAFDVHGNREYIIPNFTGYLVPQGCIDTMADYIITLMQDKELKERLRKNSLGVGSTFIPVNRWAIVREFLNL